MDLGTDQYCLGMEFFQQKNKIKIHQTGYINDILERFGMSESKTVSTPLDLGTKLDRSEEANSEESEHPYQKLVGALMYLAMCTRPDIAYTVNYLSQFNCFKNSHWTATKRVLRYFQGTKNLGLVFRKTSRPLESFTVAN